MNQQYCKYDINMDKNIHTNTKLQKNRNRVRQILTMLMLATLVGSTPMVTAAATMNQEVVNQDKITLDRPITYAEVTDKKNQLSSTYELLLADITQPKVYGIANISSRIYIEELAQLMTTLVVLKNTDLEEIVTISKNATSVSGKDNKKFGFVPGDQIKVADLLACYILTNSDDARVALVEHVARSEKDFVDRMNALDEELGTTNTVYDNSKGTYSKNQYSLAHDIYLTLYALLQEEYYTTIMVEEERTIEYISKESMVSRVCKKEVIQEEEVIAPPNGYSLVKQITSGDKENGFSQMALIKDELGHYYISFVSGPESVSVSVVSETLLAVLDGTEYIETYKEVEEVITPVKEEIKKEEIKKEEAKKEEAKKEDAKKEDAKKDSNEKDAITSEVWYVPTTSNDARYQYLLGTNYKAYTMDGPPKGYESSASALKHMTTITVPVWKIGSKGKKYASKQGLVVNQLLAQNVQCIFEEIYALDIKFPIKELLGYSYRKVGGVGLMKSTLMSIHSFGAAIDINPGNYDNDYFLGAGNDLRDTTNPYYIPDKVIAIFEKYGWFWGGDFSICSDTMHFQYLGLEFLTYQGNAPFRELKLQTSSEMSGSDVKNLQERLKKLGFLVNTDGVYGAETERVIRKAQKKYKLPVTGIVDYKTWEVIINLTHDMSYVF